jgi:hypothetical protein
MPKLAWRSAGCHQIVLHQPVLGCPTGDRRLDCMPQGACGGASSGREVLGGKAIPVRTARISHDPARRARTYIRGERVGDVTGGE